MKTFALSLSASMTWLATPSLLATPHSSSHQSIDTGCAFYVNAFGMANLSNQNFWLEGEIYVSPKIQNNKQLEVGAIVNYSSGSQGQNWSTTFVAGKTDQRYIIVMPFNDSEPETAPSYRRIDSLNIYVRYRDNNGHIQQLWATDPKQPYTPEDIFWGYPIYTRNRGSANNVTFTKYPSPIMVLKNRCSSVVR